MSHMHTERTLLSWMSSELCSKWLLSTEITPVIVSLSFESLMLFLVKIYVSDPLVGLSFKEIINNFRGKLFSSKDNMLYTSFIMFPSFAK